MSDGFPDTTCPSPSGRAHSHNHPASRPWSNGPKLAEELFSSKTATGKDLQSELPSYRWVFLVSRERQDTRFKEVMPARFDACSLAGIVEGFGESVLLVLDIIESSPGD